MKFIMDTHCHTLASGHAYSTLDELVREASKRNLELIAMTDHADTLPGGAHLFHFQNLKVIPNVINGVRVLKGIEVNILDYDGNLDMEEEVLEKLDWVIASLHPPCIEFGTSDQVTNAYLKVIENPHVNVIGHPGDERYPCDLELVVKHCKKYNTLLEINNASLKPDSFRPGVRENAKKMLEYCKKHEVPVIVASDAHVAYDVGSLEESRQLLKEVQMPEHLVVNTSMELLSSYIPKVKVRH